LIFNEFVQLTEERTFAVHPTFADRPSDGSLAHFRGERARRDALDRQNIRRHGTGRCRVLEAVIV
jgi:hypothetical protein